MTQNIQQQSGLDLSKWIDYNGLPPKQEDDLYEFFLNKMNSENLHTYEEVKDYMQPGSDTFVNFILLLEESTPWFDYTQIPQVLTEINLFLEQLKAS